MNSLKKDPWEIDNSLFKDNRLIADMTVLQEILLVNPVEFHRNGTAEEMHLTAMARAAQARKLSESGEIESAKLFWRGAINYWRRYKKLSGSPPLVPEQFRDGKVLPFKRRPPNYGICAEAAERPSVRVDDPNHYEAWEPDQ